MTHKSSHIIIANASQKAVDELPKDKHDKVEKILEKANKKVAKILGE